jgi:hypothetical protein
MREEMYTADWTLLQEKETKQMGNTLKCKLGELKHKYTPKIFIHILQKAPNLTHMLVLSRMVILIPKMIQKYLKF